MEQEKFKNIGSDLEQLARQLDRALSHLDNTERRLNTSQITPGETAFLHGAPPMLEDLGRYAEWRRAFERYMKPTERFLSQMTARDLEELAERPPTKAQINLIRTTCTYHRIDFPALSNRKVAFEWLRDIGANPRYRERQL